MFRYVSSYVTSHAEHPLLVGLYLIGGLLVTGGLVVNQITSNGVSAAFFIVFAIMAAAMASLGYGALITAKIITLFQRESDEAL